MGFRIDNDCTGCEICRHCSRGRDYYEYYCDRCKDETTELYIYGGRELCFDCLIEELNEKVLDDCDDTVCENCGEWSETLYEYMGDWYCEECLREIAEKAEKE